MAKNQELISIIEEIRFREKINQNQLAEKIGIDSHYLSDVKNGRFPLTDELRERLYVCFPYLKMRSDVTPLTEADTKFYTSTKRGTEFLERNDGKIIMQVPVVPFRTLGSPPDEYAKLIEDEEWDMMSFIVDVVHHGQYYAFRVDGDSMDDGTREGFVRDDIVLVRELDREDWMPRLRYNKWPYWVVVFGNNVRIKQIIGQDDNGNITLHSLNPSPEYTDFTLHLDDVRRLFNVVQHVPHPIKF